MNPGTEASQLFSHGLSKSYRRRQVVKSVDLAINQGEVVGLLGPNGAGKTTTFYMLVGVIQPDAGQVFVDEQEITNWPLPKRARFGLSYLPQESSVFKRLTVRQNLQMILEYSGLSKKEQQAKLTHLLSELGLTHIAEQKAMVLSGGERRRLEIARALINDPKFILLDEPFAGIDPLAVDDIQKLVLDLRQKGIGILISDHNVRETMTICDRVFLVYEGRIILQGPPEEIAAHPKAKRLYLGDNFSI